jgi:hypothetical protein
MRMLRKPVMFLSLIAVVVLAVPALASASKIEAKAGTLAPVGTNISLKSEGTVTLQDSLFGALTCESLSASETLGKNDGSTFETAQLNGTEVQTSGCNMNGNPITYEAFSIGLQSSTAAKGAVPGQGTATISFIRRLPSQRCVFSGAIPFYYALGSHQISFYSSGPLKGGAGCGSETLTGHFNVSIGSRSVILN